MNRTIRSLCFTAMAAAALSGIAGSEVRADPPVPRGFAAPKTPSFEWEQTSNEDGIVTFRRDIPGSEVIALRGEGVVDAPIVRVASVVLDNVRATEWVDSLEEARLVRMLGPTEFVEYDRIGAPPLISDRDFVCRGKVTVDLASQTLTMTLTPTTDPAVPPNDDYVRGRLGGYWKLRAVDHGRKTHVTCELHGDPRGSLPKWLVNFFQAGWPRNTIETLREQVKKRDIKTIPQVQAVFEGKPMHAATVR